MAQITHNISFPNDGNGDELRTAFDNQNQNNTDLYTNKVDKELGKGLSTNDYTNLEKTKLAGIEAGAQVNVPVQWEDIIGTPDQFSSSVGHFYIANSLAGQSITSGVQTKLLNNDAGVLSNDSFRPFGISTVYNPTNSQFDFNELDLGDQVNIRVDLLINTTVVEQDLRVYLVLGVGTPSEKKLIISQNTYKNIVSNFPLGEDVEFSIDNEDWRTAPAEIMVLTDAAATVLVEGWHVPILRKSVNILEPQDLSGKLDKNIALYPTATLPLADTDKLLISQSGVFKEVAKSELDKQNYFTFSANTTLTNAHHNATIYVSATCNITIPSGLRSDFHATFRTFTGVTATFLVSGAVINAESDGSILGAKSMAYLSVFSTNNYIISGELT